MRWDFELSYPRSLATGPVRAYGFESGSTSAALCMTGPANQGMVAA